MPDETINILYKVAAQGDQKVIEETIRLRQEVDKVRAALEANTKAAGSSYEYAARSMIKVYRQAQMLAMVAKPKQENFQMLAKGEGGFGGQMVPDKAAFKTAMESYKEEYAKVKAKVAEYAAYVKQAEALITKDLASQVAARGILYANQSREEIRLTREKLAEAKKAEKDKAKAAKDAAREAARIAGEATGIFGKIGVAANALGTAFGIGLFQMFRQLINWFQSVIQAGVDFAQNLYKLGASVRLLRQQGINITLKEAIDNVVTLRKELKVFSTSDIVGGMAQVQLLMRNFGFTKEQYANTLKMSAALAVLNGKSFLEGAKELALFYSSGYGEALQRAGISVNRLTVLQEAHRMGVKKSYMQMTEMERGQAGYNLVMRQSGDLIKELDKYTESYIGQLKEQQAAIEDLTNAFGLGLTPAMLAWAKAKVAIANTFIWIVNGALYVGSVISAVGISAVASFTMIAKNLENIVKMKFDQLFSPEDYVKTIQKILSETNKAFEETKIQPINIDEMLKYTGTINALKDRMKFDQDYADRIEKITHEMTDMLLEMDKEYNAESIELIKKSNQEKFDLKEKAAQDEIDLEEKKNESLAKLAKDLSKDIAKAQRDAEEDLADLDKETRDDVADANKKHREDELKAERDYQERLRRLREQFMFDLEDALRERDAKQVLQLIRRYKLSLEQEKRGYEESQREKDLQLKDDLEKIRKNEADKRKEIQDSLAQQIQDAKDANAEKIADIEATYAKEVQSIKDKLQEELDAAEEKYKQERIDFEAAWEQRRIDMVNKWLEANNITTQEAQALTNTLKSYFGEAGISDQIFNWFNGAVVNMATEFQNQMSIMQQGAADTIDAINALKAVEAGYSPSAAGMGNIKNLGQQASGGTYLATRPTTAIFGEAGPELATFTPLGKSGGRGGGGRGTLEISLAPGLIGEIVDNTLGEVAVVMRRK